MPPRNMFAEWNVAVRVSPATKWRLRLTSTVAVSVLLPSVMTASLADSDTWIGPATMNSGDMANMDRVSVLAACVLLSGP